MNFDLNPEQQRLQALARQVAEERIKPYATDVDLNERYPTEGLRALAEAGLCGLTITRDYGGLAADAVSSVLVLEEISRGCTSTGALMLTYGGSVLSIMAYGTPAQKEKYLPGIARGEVSLSFSLTEDHCGSDAAAIRTTAERNGDHWTLNGKKAWTGNAARADVIVTAAKTDPNARGSGVSIFLIEKGTPGVSIGEIYSKTGARGTIHSEVIFDNAQVPAANLLGEVGRGFAQMMHSLDFVRLLTAAHALGIAQAAYDEAVAYAKQREAFGQPLHRHQAISFMVADMATELHAARLITHHAAAELDAGKPVGTQAAMAKLYASEAATRIAHKAQQIHGAWGVKRGSSVERLYRDARVTEIWDGTSEIQRIVIGRSIFGR
jgi:alkylation response protein AidB-like acyl-CoA dehydrogenase